MPKQIDNHQPLKLLMASLINIYVVTFNCARHLVNDHFTSSLFEGHEGSVLPDIVVLSVQEVAPVPHSLVGGSYVEEYFARLEKAFIKAVNDDSHYKLIIQNAIGMTGIMVFSKDTLAIENIETAGVGGKSKSAGVNLAPRADSPAEIRFKRNGK